MTEKQKSLARHALGLDGRRKESYRNRYVVGSEAAEHAEWLVLVDIGYAVRHDGHRLQFGGMDLFELTYKGAVAALNRGESLDAEDFGEQP